MTQNLWHLHLMSEHVKLWLLDKYPSSTQNVASNIFMFRKAVKTRQVLLRCCLWLTLFLMVEVLCSQEILYCVT